MSPGVRDRSSTCAPKYRAYMQEHEGKDWETVEHRTHLEYQSLIRDLVLESVYRG